MTKSLFSIFTFIAGLSLSLKAAADWSLEKEKIEFLIDSVSQVDGVFIRNGEEHSSAEAEKHIRMKLDRALSSWFTPKKSKWTALMFIEKVASKSSLSGKPYRLKLSNGDTELLKEWLSKRLLEFKQKRGEK